MKTWLIAASAIGGIFASDIIRLSAIILKKNMGTDGMYECIERKAIIEKNHGGMIYIDDIKNIPVVDVAQVQHGRWECGKPCPVCGMDRFEGLDADIWADWEPPYCPNCGAKMDGE